MGEYSWTFNSASNVQSPSKSCIWSLGQFHLLLELSLFKNTFRQPASDSILQTSRIHSNDDDILCWKPATKSTCSSREAYNYLAAQSVLSLPNIGPRKISLLLFFFLRERKPGFYRKLIKVQYKPASDTFAAETSSPGGTNHPQTQITVLEGNKRTATKTGS